MNIQAGDVIVYNSDVLEVGAIVSIWGSGPLLPEWIKSKWFTDYDRYIVGSLFRIVGRVGLVIERGSATISGIDKGTNSITFS